MVPPLHVYHELYKFKFLQIFSICLFLIILIYCKTFHSIPIILTINFICVINFRKVPNGRYVDVRKPKQFVKAGFRPQAETVFIVHGFNGTARDKHMRYLKDGNLI